MLRAASKLCFASPPPRAPARAAASAAAEEPPPPAKPVPPPGGWAARRHGLRVAGARDAPQAAARVRRPRPRPLLPLFGGGGGAERHAAGCADARVASAQRPACAGGGARAPAPLLHRRPRLVQRGDGGARAGAARAAGGAAGWAGRGATRPPQGSRTAVSSPHARLRTRRRRSPSIGRSPPRRPPRFGRGSVAG